MLSLISSPLRRLLAPALFTCATTVALAGDDDVPVKWDNRGIPHVVASTDEQVWFGQGYAMAVDRLAQLHRIREATYGRLAELLGAPSMVEGKTPFEQDEEVLHVGIREAAMKRFMTLDEPTRSALTSFAAGVNAYLDQLDAMGPIPDNFLAEPLEVDPMVKISIEDGSYPDWTPEDSIAAWTWWAYWFNGGSGRYANELDCGVDPTDFQQPVAEENTVIAQGDVNPMIQQRIGQYWALYDQDHATDCTTPCPGTPVFCAAPAVAGPSDVPEGQMDVRPERRFSEAWVLSGLMNNDPESDAALLQSSTKAPIMTPNMFHEIHLTQADPVAGWDVRGVQIVGAPGLFNAFSDRIAWASTSVDPDTDDLIRLDVDPRTQQYMLDGATYTIESSTVSVYNGTEFEDVTIERSVLGPIVDALINPSLTANSLRHVLRSTDFWDAEERHTVQAIIRLPKARDVRQFRQASKYWRSLSVHCVFGDADGDIGYQPFMAVPTRGDPACDAGERVVCDGSSSSNDWQRTVPFDLLPWTIKSDGYLAVANNRPTGCWYPIPLLLNVAKAPSTRSVRLWEILEGHEEAYSTFPEAGNVEELARMSFDAVAIHERGLIEMGKLFRDDPCFDLSPDAEATVNLLENWLDLGAQSKLVNTSQWCLNDFLKIANLSYRVTCATPLLVREYGTGGGGFVALFHDMILRNFMQDPLDCSDPFDQQLFAYIQALLEEAGGCALPSGTTFPTSFAYFDFTKRVGGSTPSMNPAKDVDVNLIAIDSTTLWDAPSRSFSQTVDLGSPDEARGLHPLGNHEDPDYPELGAFYKNETDPMTSSAAAVWINGTVGGGTQPYFDALAPMSLGEPGTVVHCEVQAHAPKVSYYGLDYGGKDPQRALSIGLANPTQTLSPGALVGVRIAGIPRIADLDLPSPELQYRVELRADMQKVWQPDPMSPVIYLVDPALTPVDTETTTAAWVDLTVQIPSSALPGDEICLQAVLKLNNAVLIPVGHPLTPSARVSTMGMVLVVE